jgi:hypothetical protein
LLRLPGLPERAYNLIVASTKKGIKYGVEEFLKNDGRPGKLLYPLDFDDIGPANKSRYKLMIDDTIEGHILREIKALHLVQEERYEKAFAGYACEHYRLFITNDSIGAFRHEKFYQEFVIRK